MYFADHPLPHFHIITVADEEVIHLIETLEVRDGEADPRGTAEVLSWVAANRAELWARWREYSEEEET
jgi:hypothetical protein